MRAIRLLAALLTAALLVAACGGPGEGKNVKDAIKQFLSDRETGDAEAVCKGITPESRRLLDTLGRGSSGADAGCPEAFEEDLLGGAYAVGQQELEAIESADVNIDGDVARVKGPGDEDDKRLPLRRVDGEWLVDYANMPGVGYSLRASAVCTENNLRPQGLALPGATREGVAKEADRDAEGFARMEKLLRRLGPPDEDKQADHDAIVAFMRANQREWKRAAARLRGLGRPLQTYNRALKAVGRRAEDLRDEQRSLQIGCLGLVDTREGADDYRREAERVCSRTLRRMKGLPTATTPREARSVAGRGAAIGRQTSAALGRLDPPEGLEKIHERSASALRESYGGLTRLAAADDLERAQERFELVALRSAIGFLRIGLQTCAQL